MRLWRLQRGAYPALDGEGARRHGGRWNTKGRAVAYCSTHLSLAILELLVHTDPDLVPGDLTLFEIEVPDVFVIATPSDEHGGIRMASLSETQAIGDIWLSEPGHAPLLRVPSMILPSAVVPEESNVLLDVAHRDAPRVTVSSVTPFQFDERLL